MRVCWVGPWFRVFDRGVDFAKVVGADLYQTVDILNNPGTLKNYDITLIWHDITLPEIIRNIEKLRENSKILVGRETFNLLGNLVNFNKFTPDFIKTLGHYDAFLCHCENYRQFWTTLTDKPAFVVHAPVPLDRLPQQKREENLVCVGTGGANPWKGFILNASAFKKLKKLKADIRGITLGVKNAFLQRTLALRNLIEPSIELRHWANWDSYINDVARLDIALVLGPQSGQIDMLWEYEAIGVPCVTCLANNLSESLKVPFGNVEEATKLAFRLLTDIEFREKVNLDLKNNKSQLDVSSTVEKFRNIFKVLMETKM